jgi:hypothetical protein
VRDGTRETVKAPNHHSVESAVVRVGQQAVEFGPLFLCAGDSNIDVLASDLPAAPLAVFKQFPKLHHRVLAVVGGGNACIKGRAESCRGRLLQCWTGHWEPPGHTSTVMDAKESRTPASLPSVQTALFHLRVEAVKGKPHRLCSV